MDDAMVAELIAKRVAIAVREEMKREFKQSTAALLTIPEVAAKYRMREDDVRAAVEVGKVKCKKVKPRFGERGYLVDAKDAERVFGAS